MYQKNYEMENYKLQMELLQEKLKHSEEHRRQLEEKLEHIKQKRLSQEKTLNSKARQRYLEFLEEQKKRNEQNKALLKMLERVDSQAATLAARSDQLKMMKMQYEMYFAKLVQSQTMRCLQEAKTQQQIPTLMTTNPVQSMLVQPTSKLELASGTSVMNQDATEQMNDSRSTAYPNSVSCRIESGKEYAASANSVTDAYQIPQYQWAPPTSHPSVMLTNNEYMKYSDEYLHQLKPDPLDDNDSSKLPLQRKIIHCSNDDTKKPHRENPDDYSLFTLPGNDAVTRSHRSDGCGRESVEEIHQRNESIAHKRGDSTPLNNSSVSIWNDNSKQISKKICEEENDDKICYPDNSKYDPNISSHQAIAQFSKDSLPASPHDKYPQSLVISESPLNDDAAAIKENKIKDVDTDPLPETIISDESKQNNTTRNSLLKNSCEDYEKATKTSTTNRLILCSGDNYVDIDDDLKKMSSRDEIEERIDPNNGNGIPTMTEVTPATKTDTTVALPSSSSSSSSSTTYHPVKFTKKEKMSIENIENVIYGEVVKPLKSESHHKKIDVSNLKIVKEIDSEQVGNAQPEEINELLHGTESNLVVASPPAEANQRSSVDPATTSNLSTADYDAMQTYSYPAEAEQYAIDGGGSAQITYQSDGQDYQNDFAEDGEEQDDADIDYPNYDMSAYSYENNGQNGGNANPNAAEGYNQQDYLQQNNGEQTKQHHTEEDYARYQQEMKKSAQKETTPTAVVEEVIVSKEKAKIPTPSNTIEEMKKLPTISSESKKKLSPAAKGKPVKGKLSIRTAAEKASNAEKKKKRVNFIDSETDEGSAKTDFMGAVGGVSSESDFDFASPKKK